MIFISKKSGGSPTPGPSGLIDNQGTAYFTSTDNASDSVYLYLEANFRKQVDNQTMILYECFGRSVLQISSDNTVYAKIENSSGGVIWDASSTETVTVADGEVTLEFDIDNSLSTGSAIIRKNDVPLTLSNPFIGTGVLIDHGRNNNGFLADESGNDKCDMHVGSLKVSTDNGSTYIFDMSAVDGVSNWNSGVNGGTFSITANGTFVEV